MGTDKPLEISCSSTAYLSFLCYVPIIIDPIDFFSSVCQKDVT